MRTMTTCTYDTNTVLGIALVAEDDWSGARYVPLADAPTARGEAAAPYLRQMHAVANSVPHGLVVSSRIVLVPNQWACLGLR